MGLVEEEKKRARRLMWAFGPRFKFKDKQAAVGCVCESVIS